MGIIRWLADLFGSSSSGVSSYSRSSSKDDFEPIEGTVINPATGLPMIGGIAGLDAGGNPYGFGELVGAEATPGGIGDDFGSDHSMSADDMSGDDMMQSSSSMDMDVGDISGGMDLFDPIDNSASSMGGDMFAGGSFDSFSSGSLGGGIDDW